MNRLKIYQQVKTKFGKNSDEYSYCVFADDKTLKSFCNIFNFTLK